jgi:hypothetical protein
VHQANSKSERENVTLSRENLILTKWLIISLILVQNVTIVLHLVSGGEIPRLKSASGRDKLQIPDLKLIFFQLWHKQIFMCWFSKNLVLI